MGETGDQVEALTRGLAALAALNAHGQLNLGALSTSLNLPRTTVRRIMTTLISEGYCLRAPGGQLYGLAPGVQRLSRGYGMIERLTAAAIEILPPLGQAIGWPVAFVVPEVSAMRVKVSTDFTSRFALARMRPGYATPLVETTTGLIYLASLDADEANERLNHIYKAKWRSPLRFARDEVESLMSIARKDGFLIVERQFPEGSLGVPLTIGGTVRGGLVMRYVRSAIRKEDVRTLLLPKLHKAAGDMLAWTIDDQCRNGTVTGS